jgi:ubiquinone/menaquinone biosynthesis C-methylase UbiE
MLSIANPEYWENRYQEGTTRWDLGRAAPPLQSFLNSTQAPPAGKIAVLGCGRGYDAMLFAEHGFEVIGFDFAKSAIADATVLAQTCGSSAKFMQRDIFELPAEFSDEFDYVLEHTCFCAIDPSQRSAYVKLVRDILRSQGEIIGLFWAHTRPGGPPFGTTTEEIQQLFAPDFNILSLELVTNSIPERQGDEYLGRFQKK